MSEFAASSPAPSLPKMWKIKSFMLIIASRVIIRFGDSIDSIAYSWMVYMLTGSKALMGALFAFNYVPGILFSLFTGVLVDRWPKQRIIFIAHLSRGAIVALTAFLYWKGLLQPWHLFLFTFLNSTLECFASPAEMALVPRVLPKELLLKGNSVSSTASRTSELIGLAAAGALIATIGISGAILIDSLTFIIGGLLVGFVRTAPEPSSAAGTKADQKSYWTEFKEGFAFIRSFRLLFTIMIVAAFVNMCLIPFNVLNPVYVKEVLQSGPVGLSILSIGIVVGMIVSGLWMSHKGSSYKKSTLIVTGFLMLGFFYAMMYIPGLLPASPLTAAAIFSFGMGTAIPLINTTTSTYLMEVTPREMLGRVGALFGMVCTCAIPVGSLLAGIAAEYIPVHLFYLGLGALLMLPAFYLLRQKTFMSM